MKIPPLAGSKILVLGFTLVALLGGSAAHAASTRYIGVKGTSTGPGTATIDIESFGSEPSDVSRLLPSYSAHLTIGAGSTQSQTAFKLRDTLDAVLPADYVVVLATPTVVRLTRTTTPGAFVITSIVENIPNQTIEERGGLPALDARGWAALATLMLVSGAWVVRRRLALRHGGSRIPPH